MTTDVVERFTRQRFCHLSEKPTLAHTPCAGTPRVIHPGGSELIMSPTRIPNPELDDLAAPRTEDDSVRNVPEAERHARLREQLDKAELELAIQASALRLQSLALVQGSLENEPEIA